jgi:DNA-binding NtrC family response regulator
MTAHATVEKAVETMKLGAVDYIQKPFDFDSMKEAIRKALERREDRRERLGTGPGASPGGLGGPATTSQPDRSEREDRPELIGESPAMKELIGIVEAVAATDSTVLITGETGTGKELVAAAIHRQSQRSSKPLVSVNCAAIPEGLLESEMFGYVRGAFTGATQNRRGKFALAHGGSLFLDEISGLSSSLQQKLLRVLQEKEFEPLGSEKTIKVDVRILAATNRDLAELTKSGQFQEDLFYRLNVIPVRVRPLRERREDIPLLARSFLASFSKKLGKPFRDFSPEALGRLASYDWPGNVRELENAINRGILLAPHNAIEAHHLDPRVQTAVDAVPTGVADLPFKTAKARVVDDFEKRYLLALLADCEGNITRAAQRAETERRTLGRLLQKHGIERGAWTAG